MIRFRELIEDDLTFFLEIRNECREFLHNNSFFSLQESKDWFLKKSSDYFIINYFGQDIGYFRTSNYLKEENSIYIGADLHKIYRGNGFATKSYNSFIKNLYNEKGITTFILEVLSHNITAIKLYLKIGFKVVDRKKNYTKRGNNNIDNIIMKLGYRDFLNSQSA